MFLPLHPPTPITETTTEEDNNNNEETGNSSGKKNMLDEPVSSDPKIGKNF